MPNPQPETRADILVVDDSPLNLRFLVNLLTEQGYRVRPAQNGRLALAAAQAQPPDLILLDIVMADMDGYEVCRTLQAHERTRAIPVIFVSTLNDPADKARAFAAGGVDYLTKPFQPDELLARIKPHLLISQLQRQLKLARPPADPPPLEPDRL